MPTYDLIIRNTQVVRHDDPETRPADIGIAGGKVVEVARHLEAGDAEVFDASGLLAFPGVVDAHQHWGIYNPLEVDATTESKAAAQGGVTTALNYIRTGQYYLGKSGPYREFFPEVLQRAQGRAFIDYGFHVAPITRQHLGEVGTLIDTYGVTSFKIFMFYGGYGLHGRSDRQSEFLMTPPGERYDVAHFEFVMRAIAKAREERPALTDSISLSLHCETAEIMDAYTQIVQAEGKLAGLAAYSASRPPHSEGLAISVASYLAHETGLPSINLLHLSSAKALGAALRMATAFPETDFRREVTIGHLMADISSARGIGGKVNPPLRPREDVEALWSHLIAGDIDWVSSDHACCRDEMKFGQPREDLWVAKSGFGGAEYLLPGLVSEGAKRGLSPDRVALLTSWAPARRFGLPTKGAIGPGFDADVALVDPGSPWVVRASDSLSSQEYTPFEGMELGARVAHVFLRGHQILDDGRLVGSAMGKYLFRPSGT